MFASVNTYLGVETSRRDDMVSLGYSLVYLLQGRLPWSHISKNKTALFEVKNATVPDVLCEDLPIEFARFFDHCLSLGTHHGMSRR